MGGEGESGLSVLVTLFVGLSVKSPKFEWLSVKGKRYGVVDLAVFVRFLGERIKTGRFFGDCHIRRFLRNDYPCV